MSATHETSLQLDKPEARLADKLVFPEDLFWAVRGGGGNFGVVTAPEFALYPHREVYAGALFWPLERGQEILEAWSRWTATVRARGGHLNRPAAAAALAPSHPPDRALARRCSRSSCATSAER